jgi:prolyl oligopeptidase
MNRRELFMGFGSLCTGVTDPRVGPFHVAKMAGRLQAASSSGKPVLLRVDFDAGHGIGSTRTQQDRESADTYASAVADGRNGLSARVSHTGSER